MSENDEAHDHYLRALELEAADRKAARSAYEACLEGDCAHVEARINLGRLLHLEGLNREAEALRYYPEAVIHDPGMPDAHWNLSLLLDQRGETQSAYRHLLAYHRLTREQTDG